MKRIFTLLLSFLAVTITMAQNQEGVFKKASSAPAIDGVVDAVWAESNVYNIERVVGTNTPTIGAPGESVWKGLWNEDGVYILLDIKDDAFFPNYVNGGGNDYDFDKLEIYFDVNYLLADGLGPEEGKGHYQIAPGFKLDQNDGRLLSGGEGVQYALKVDGSHYIAEYFVAFSKLLDSEGVQVDKLNTIGFDVTVIDRDPGQTARNQAVWSNTGEAGESWGNMDGAGHVTFEGAVANILAETISIENTDLTISTDKGTLQLVAKVGPEATTIKTVRWIMVDGTAQATISPSGLVSAFSNGTLIVKAATTDGSYLETEPVTITITNQVAVKYSDDTWNVNNIIRNWNYDTDVTEWGGWVDDAVTGQAAPAIVEGVAVLKAGKASDGAAWHYQHNQENLGAEANVPYTLKFKSWATATAECIVDFESGSSIKPADGGDQYVRYGTDTDTNGASEWKYTVTKVPSWFTYHVIFDKMIETTQQKVQWMISLSDETIYLDSVLLVKTEDIEIISKNGNQYFNSINKVYPNPVANTLVVELSAVNAKVAIYNALGQRLMEKTSKGNRITIDVSSLRKGMYFVKLEDGSIQKFVK